MRRSSSRLKNKNTPAAPAHPPEVSSNSSTDPANTAPIQKKRKVSAAPKTRADAKGNAEATTSKMPQAWKGVKGKRGSLKKLVDVPCDILLEIFGHLSVSDLHTLATSSKALRAMLLSRSLSVALWKDAFARLSPAPPPCPEEITLPQYASLLYSRHCFTCDAKATDPTRSWQCLSVFCKNCLYTQFMDPREGEVPVGVAANITPVDLSRGPGRERPTWRYFRPAYREHQEVLQSLSDRDEERLRYIDQEKAKLEFRYKHRECFDHWRFAQNQAKSNDQQARRFARENAIVEKLRELGYGDVLQRIEQEHYARARRLSETDKFSLLKEFISVKPLTNKDWEKIRPAVVEVIERAKQGYVQSDRRSLILKRSDQLKEAYDRYLEGNPEVAPYAPPAGRLAKLEPFRAAIYDTPKEQADAVLIVINNLDNYGPTIETWKAHADEVLRKLMGTKYVGRDQVEYKLAEVYRPRAGFKCTRCGETAIMYPEALTHPCLYAEETPFFRRCKTDPNVEWDFNEGPSRLVYDARLYYKAREVMDAYEVDLETVTCKELDEADADGLHILECTRCEMSWLHENWRKALSHELSRHTPGDYEHLTDIKWRRHLASKLPELRAKTRIPIAEYADYYSL